MKCFVLLYLFVELAFVYLFESFQWLHFESCIINKYVHMRYIFLKILSCFKNKSIINFEFRLNILFIFEFLTLHSCRKIALFLPCFLNSAMNKRHWIQGIKIFEFKCSKFNDFFNNSIALLIFLLLSLYIYIYVISCTLIMDHYFL